MKGGILKSLIFSPIIFTGISLLEILNILLKHGVINPYQKTTKSWQILFFSIGVFFTGQQEKEEDHLLFHWTTSTRSQTLRHLFAILLVRWLSRTFNRNTCVYQTATQWHLPPYWNTIWVIDWWCNVCLFTWWIGTRFLLQRFHIGNRWIWTCINYHPGITSKIN